LTSVSVRIALVALVWCWLAGSGSLARACSVPVFRYALERWSPDDYEVVVYYRDGLTAGQQEIVDWLAEQASGARRAANLRLVLTELASAEGQALGELFRSEQPSQLPWMVVRYVRVSEVPEVLWSGPLIASSARALVDSPARREIIKRLVDGESAVWVLLASGDEAQDASAARLLSQELSILQKNLELPEPEDGLVGLAMPEDSAPLRIAFSVLKVSRADPAEKFFVAMLLATEPDLDELDGPMAFPVFGRGRALYALVSRGITERNIADACSFLVGPCACLIKARNPGHDVLMAVDWDNAIKGDFAGDVELPPLMGLPDLADEGSGDSEGESGRLATSPGAAGGALLRNVFVTVGLVLLVFVIMLGARRRLARG
jgi:hypothetical protein